MSDTRPVYALIPACGTDSNAESALMAQARQLAAQRDGISHVIVAGACIDNVLAQAHAAGLDHAWHIAVSANLQTHQLVDAFAAALEASTLAEGLRNALVLVLAGTDNEAFAGALAARLSGIPLGRCTGFTFVSPTILHAHRSAYGNRLNVTCAVAANAGPAVAAVRPQGSPMPRDRQTEIHNVDLIDIRDAYATTLTPHAERHAQLEGANIVIAGGRGSGEAAFPALYDLAEKLGGAVGASLPAVDAGWAPVNRQIGISGNYVRPNIYLAIGISGTPQHLAGIDPYTHIVAINNDADANIFNVAQLGVVGEWQSVLPALIQALDTPAAA